MSKKYIKVNENNTEFVKKIEKNNKNIQVFDENKRFFVKSAKIGQVKIEGDEHNHLSNVMRFKVGDEVILVCNDDYDYSGKIIEITRNYSIADVLQKRKNNANPSVQITAFVAVNKREPMSLMVRMLSELGVTDFVPITTKWTQAQDATEKLERYQKIADQSAKQCRRSKTLNVLGIKTLDEICSYINEFDTVLFAYEKENAYNLDQYFDANSNKYKNVAFIIGPVAGFDTDEAEKIVKSGAVSVSLGKRILKADTACVAMASIIMNKLDK